MKTCYRIALMCVFVFVYGRVAAQKNEGLDLFTYWTYYSDAENAQYKSLCDVAFNQLEKRAKNIQKLYGKKDWAQRRNEVRNTLRKVVGSFPGKTPLNARITGAIEENDYTVEKVLYESRPDFYVTAVLYIPKHTKSKQAPAVLYCSGHSANAFRSETYQHVCINLVKKGFVVLAFDPIGQGERFQYVGGVVGEGPQYRASSSSHFYVGAQCFISGSSLARYFIWDGIRSIDYLISRDEVDPDRIGVAGRSGGGTQSAYIAAFDDRVRAASPESYITNFKTLLKSRTPQDCEQNFYHGIMEGLDQGDLLIARMPKPAQIRATTRDIFSFKGTQETYKELRAGYKAFGVPEHLELSTDDDVHNSTKKNREAMYAFFREHLELPGDKTDEKVEIHPEDELHVTATGQVFSSIKDAKQVFDVNQSHSKKLVEDLSVERKGRLDIHLESLPGQVIHYTGYQRPDSAEVTFSGRFRKDGYYMEKYLLEVNETYGVPLLAFVPDTRRRVWKGVILYLHPEGKSTEAREGERLEWLARQGYVVVAPDVRGTGELSGGYIGGTFGSYRRWQAGVLTGISIMALKMQDMTRVLTFIQGKFGAESRAIQGMAEGTECATLLHQTAVCSELTHILMMEPLVSYRSVVMERNYEPKYIENSVPGMLETYDLPDLVAARAPHKVWMINAVNAEDKRICNERLASEYAFVREVYADVGLPEHFVSRSAEKEEEIRNIIREWLGK